MGWCDPTIKSLPPLVAVGSVDVLAQEIADDLQTATDLFIGIAVELKK
jgi:hypothetical protein